MKYLIALAIAVLISVIFSVLTEKLKFLFLFPYVVYLLYLALIPGEKAPWREKVIVFAVVAVTGLLCEKLGGYSLKDFLLVVLVTAATTLSFFLKGKREKRDSKDDADSVK